MYGGTAGREAAVAGRWTPRGPYDYVRAAAAHVSKVSAAKTLADASIGWTSARGSPIMPKSEPPPYSIAHVCRVSKYLGIDYACKTTI